MSFTRNVNSLLIPSTPPISRGPRLLFHFTLSFIYFQLESVGEKGSVFSTATYVLFLWRALSACFSSSFSKVYTTVSGGL